MRDSECTLSRIKPVALGALRQTALGVLRRTRPCRGSRAQLLPPLSHTTRRSDGSGNLDLVRPFDACKSRMIAGNSLGLSLITPAVGSTLHFAVCRHGQPYLAVRSQSTKAQPVNYGDSGDCVIERLSRKPNRHTRVPLVWAEGTKCVIQKLRSC